MFDIIPDFNDESRGGSVCSNCGSPRMPGDIGVAQGEFLDFEGSYDVCQACIIQIAGEFGMISTEQFEGLKERVDWLNIEVEAAIKLLDNEKLLNSSLAMQLGRAAERLDEAPGKKPVRTKLLQNPGKA